MGTLFRIFVCIFWAGLLLYNLVSHQNALTTLRLEIPPLAKEARKIQEDNARLEYEIDRFENPIHLMQLQRQPEYSHLKHPLTKDIIILPAGEEAVE